MRHPAPGNYRPAVDRWGRFEDLVGPLKSQLIAVVDQSVLALHPKLAASLRAAKPCALVALPAGERSKTFRTVERIVSSAAPFPRGTPLVAIGGGTVGDVATVAAHLCKRGAPLIHVPTTLLAAVDSSAGGKGAVHVPSGGHWLKNAGGAFHYPVETWLCPDLFSTLRPGQLREGSVEAWKMIACLDAATWRRYRIKRPTLVELVRRARALKGRVCRLDPYDQEGRREVLNFGHTFGHALESLSRFRISHGDAVSLGILCALDVGRALGVTPFRVADEVEAGFSGGLGVPGRAALAGALRLASPPRVEALLAADKKRSRKGALRMVLLRRVGAAQVRAVPPEAWRALFPAWRRGVRP